MSNRAREFAVDLGELHIFLKEQISDAQHQYQKSANNQCVLPPDFMIGQDAYVKAQFFCITHPTKKLADKYLGPFKIIARVGTHNYTLQLPEALRSVHPVFHVCMLEPHHTSSIPNRTAEPPPPVEVEGELEYEIAEVLDSKLDRRRRCKLQYLVKWRGYEGTDEETSWLPADELGNASDLVLDFHRNYLAKPAPIPQDA